MEINIYGAAGEAFQSQTPRIVLEGPAGTGKSLPICAKIHSLATLYPLARIGIVREKRVDLNHTVIPQYMDMIGPKHPCYKDIQAKSIDSVKYPNGSSIMFAGLDNVGRLMGTELDILWINEGTVGILPEHVEKLETRLRGPMRTPYRQTIIDCNPAQPTHWLNRWPHESDYIQRFKSRHKDNPVLFDGRDWTPAGVQYMRTLGNLTGATRKRMLEGLWVAAEGAVFDELSEEKNTFSPDIWRRGYPVHLPVIVGLDWGTAAPFAAIALMIDADSRTVYAIDERYEARLTAYSQSLKVQEMVKPFQCQAIFYDPSMDNNTASDKDLVPGPPPIEDYYHLGIPLIKGRNDSRTAGINKIKSMLMCIEGGWSLKINKVRCPNLWAELEGAIWHQTLHGVYIEDIDPRLPDHAITALYYAIRTYFEGLGSSQEEWREINPYGSAA